MELTLQQIKTITFEILKHFKSYCEDNNIRYFLSNGTLLGAVKHGGFIPWDDAIDVFVPREDYDRLVEQYRDTGRYRLVSIEREPEYRFPFAKLCDTTTIKEEIGIDNGVQLGINVDIFPLDSCSAHILAPGIQRRIMINLRGCMLSKFSTTGDRPFYKRWVINFCRFRGYSYFHRKLTGLINKERTFGDTHKGCLMWPIYGKREIVPQAVFADTVYVKFEGELFPAPIGYDTYLHSLYGDYMKDPPLEKQKTHHSFKSYLVDLE